jgi:tRNA (guanine37-N1)-methyltransferase
MEFHILTLFPEMFISPFNCSILKKAQERGLIKIIIHDIRNFTLDKHRVADDYPYGGGAGMVLKMEPIVRAIEYIQAQGPKARVILMSPQGYPFNQKKAQALAQEDRIIIVCGHYEGIDERVNYYTDEEISIGDYILTGGELPAMVLVDAVARLIPQVLGCDRSIYQDSFYSNLLDYPHYTRPAEFRGKRVPEVLLSGNHQAIERWRRTESLRRTWQRRPELLKEADLSPEDLEVLKKIASEE